MGRHHGHAARSRLHGFHHVQNESIVALGLGRQATAEPAEAIRRRRIMPPLFKTEGRVGDDDIKMLQPIIGIQQFRIADGVAPFNAVIILAMEKHVHLGQRPCAANRFLTIERIFLGAKLGFHLLPALHEKRA